MHTGRVASAAIAKALEDVLAAEAPAGVVSVYLFGSQAAGRSHRDSDVDIGVLVRRSTFPTGPERFEARVALSGLLGRALGRNDVDLVVLNDAPPGLARRIVTEGCRVYCSARELDHDFVRDVQLRAADLAPFRRRMAALKLAAIRR